MPNNLAELKALILLMKEQKVQSFSADGVQVTFAPDAFPVVIAPDFPIRDERTPEQVRADLKKEEDAILFHSAG
jgi:hypothetical protein